MRVWKKSLVVLLYMSLVVNFSHGCSCESSDEKAGSSDSKGGDGGLDGSASTDGDIDTDSWENPILDGGEGTTTAGDAGNIDVDGGSDCIDCVVGETGVGTGQPFDMDGTENESVRVDDDGALIIDRTQPSGPALIWINNNTGWSGDTISKIDTETLVELARYRVGSIDPSRTSVGPTGDAYVGSRFGGGVTKISAKGLDCPDSNGDGLITTSTGPLNVLSFGDDDCVLWYTALPIRDNGLVRGVAVQVVPGKTIIEEVADGPPVITQIPSKEYVWVGTTENSTGGSLYKLDGETGELLIDMNVPAGIYGLALDGRDKLDCGGGAGSCGGPYLWMTNGWYGGGLVHLDTNKCVDEASCSIIDDDSICDGACCQVTCSETDCSNVCDNAIMAEYTFSDNGTYGITVDCKQRIWLGGCSQGGDGPIKRYDPFAPEHNRFSIAGGDTTCVNGIAADGAGWIWGARNSNSVVRLDADTLDFAVIADVPSYGIGVDRAGKVWALPQADTTHIIEPGPTLQDATVQMDVVAGLERPYVYSDMTGQQLALASNEPGYYRQQFEGCQGEEITNWVDMFFDVEVPAGSHITFSIRAADTAAGLATANWILVAVLPGGTNPEDIGSLINQLSPRFVEVEVKLYMDNPPDRDKQGCTVSEAESPRVKNFGVRFSCESIPDTDTGTETDKPVVQ